MLLAGLCFARLTCEEIGLHTTMMKKRNVLLHYHIFKNAGTTFERVLDENYGDRHMTFDGPFSFSLINQDQAAAVIEHHASHIAFSSHQIHLPVPSSLSFRAIPVVFVRHPLLRIRSVYLFSQRDQVQSSSDTTCEPLAGFEAWFASMLAGDKNRLHLSNMQTGALSRTHGSPPARRGENGRVCFDLQAAINNLLLVPCLGRTEHFDADVASFTKTLSRLDIAFSYRPGEAENVSSADHKEPIERQLATFRDRVKPETWEQLNWMNHQDLALYDIVQEMMEQRLTEGVPIHFA